MSTTSTNTMSPCLRLSSRRARSSSLSWASRIHCRPARPRSSSDNACTSEREGGGGERGRGGEGGGERERGGGVERGWEGMREGERGGGEERERAERRGERARKGERGRERERERRDESEKGRERERAREGGRERWGGDNYNEHISESLTVKLTTPDPREGDDRVWDVYGLFTRV